MNYSANVDAAIAQLMTLFPGVANLFTWKDAIYRAQTMYQAEQPGQADLQLYVAHRWVQLAESNCLEVSSDPISGLSVRESLNSEQPSPAGAIMRKKIAKLLFKKLSVLADGRLLQIYEFMAAFKSATNESLASYQSDFEAVIDDLCAKQYVVHRRAGRHGMDLFSKGIDFDSWAEEITGGVRVATGNIFNFHGAVGAVQTGPDAVAHVQQVVGADQLANLKSALQAVQADLGKANISTDERDEAQELIENTIAEVDKPKPSRLTLNSLLSGVAAATQMLSATSDAYKTVKDALVPFGISLP
ncbi:hypothetical protein [Caballeronia sordidicola]|uniref:hypothetical protein n=1 Tax=Caballeronia sordidicola TaxID=196367 RepID=UPI000763D9C5|nr:hypothetical protein [Caballeronia sordidicola]